VACVQKRHLKEKVFHFKPPSLALFVRNPLLTGSFIVIKFLCSKDFYISLAAIVGPKSVETMLKRFTALMIFALPALVWGQQDIQFTQFMNNKLFYNPGFAGMNGSICANLTHRSQWAGFDGAPTTQNLNIDMPIKRINSGVGLVIVNDQIGYFQDISAGLVYSYHLKLGEGTLGLGLMGNFINKGLASGEWITPDGTPADQDQSIAGFNNSTMTVDLNFGAYYQSDKLWGGISSARLIEADAELDNAGGGVTQFRNTRHYFFAGGYTWEIPNSNWALQPNILLKTTFSSPLAFDINASALYNNKIWGGLTYRNQDAFAVMVGYNILPSLKLAYSYDITTSDLSANSGGSHEIFLSYCFKIEIPPRERGDYKDPRNM
jgi:type IX secretion system PorP/SprF family membrane protein